MVIVIFEGEATKQSEVLSAVEQVFNNNISVLCSTWSIWGTECRKKWEKNICTIVVSGYNITKLKIVKGVKIFSECTVYASSMNGTVLRDRGHFKKENNLP